jgi:hypothetical protein
MHSGCVVLHGNRCVGSGVGRPSLIVEEPRLRWLLVHSAQPWLQSAGMYGGPGQSLVLVLNSRSALHCAVACKFLQSSQRGPLRLLHAQHDCCGNSKPIPWHARRSVAVFTQCSMLKLNCAAAAPPVTNKNCSHCFKEGCQTLGRVDRPCKLPNHDVCNSIPASYAISG